MTRLAWRLGNWLAQIVFAFRIGYRDGSMLRPGARPKIWKAADETPAMGGGKMAASSRETAND